MEAQKRKRVTGFIERNWIYILLITAPIIVNYGFFTWKMPGVYDNPSAWLGFLGNYLGIIGAISIAIMQFKNQKERDRQVELEEKRSYVVMNEIRSKLSLKNIQTHENSRLIHTPGYTELLDKYPGEEDFITTDYLKIAHYGSEVILNCKICVEFNSLDESKKYLNANVGVIESGIEIFIPIVPKGMDTGQEIEINSIQITYQTLTGEKMAYIIDHTADKECFSVINSKGESEIIFDQEILTANWTFINKLKH